MNIRILLVEDHKIVREGLKKLLEQQPGVKVAAEAADGNSAVALARKCRPSLVIMDITLPDMNGIEATRKIIGENPRAKVIALSMHSDRRFVLEMLKVGARGYLLKDSAFEELASAMETVMAGRTYLSSQITDLVVREYVSQDGERDNNAFSILTAREREVLQLLAEGCATKQIATKLSLSVKTVETHRKQIMDKLGTRSIAELTKYAIREGLTTL